MPLFAGICGLLAVVVCIAGTRRLDVHSMEGIIALGGEHMFATGEWFVPKLYGTVYAYKPALAYWLAGLSLDTFGRSESALRLPTALCGVSLCLAVFWCVARLVTPRCGLYAGLAMCTSVLFYEQGRITGYDMPLALGVGVAMLGATRNLVLRRPSLGWWSVAYLGLVIGFLSKGAPALGMFGPGVLVAAGLLRQFRQLFSWQHLAGVSLAALAIGLYLWLAYRQEGPAAFGDQYGEISYRSGLWDLQSILQSLVKPVVIWAAFLPGSALLPFLLARSRRTMPLRARRVAVACWSFLLSGVIVWMLLTTYSTRYYLPLIAPMAGLAGLAAECVSPNPFRGRTGRRIEGKACSGSGRVAWENYRPGIIVTLIGLACWGFYATVAQPGKVGARSERAAAAAFAPHLAPNEAIYVDTFDTGSSLFYYLNHPVKRWSLGGHPPVENVYSVVLTEKQKPVLTGRNDLKAEIVASRRSGEGRTWLLAKVMPSTASARDR